MTVFTRKIALTCLLSLTVLVGCSSEPPRKSNEAAARSYEIKGKVVALDQKKPAVTLDHEDIPGLMKGMEMEFQVEDPQVLKDLKPGDQVKGELVKDKTGYVIKRLEKR